MGFREGGGAGRGSTSGRRWSGQLQRLAGRPEGLGEMPWAVGDLSDQTLRPCNSSFGAIKVA